MRIITGIVPSGKRKPLELSNNFSGNPDARTAKSSRISNVLLRAPIELQHSVGVGLTDGLKLLGCEPQFIRQQQLRQGMPWSVDGSAKASSFSSGSAWM